MAFVMSDCSQQQLSGPKDSGENGSSPKWDRTYFGSEYHAQSHSDAAQTAGEWETLLG